MAFLGLGVPLLLFSMGYLLSCGLGEYGWMSWFAYALGPATLGPGLVMVPIGASLAAKARRIRPPK